MRSFDTLYIFKHMVVAILFAAEIICGSLHDVSVCEAAVLPSPTCLLLRSRTYEAPLLKGLRFDPAQPQYITFFIDGEDAADVSRSQAKKQIEYFLAALTMPQDDIWVNLSPYEKERMIPDALSKTALGRDLLAQDYLLKLFSSSMTHPDTESGRVYWEHMAALGNGVQSKGAGKVFVVPKQYEILVDGDVACIGSTSIDVAFENDQLAMRECVLPKIKAEVETGEQFAYLRQMFNSIALAIWFKQTYGAVYRGYIDGKHLAGIERGDASYAREVFSKYERSFVRGVYDCRRQNTENGRRVVRQYFSGGIFLPKHWVSPRATSLDLSREMGQNGYECKIHLVPVRQFSATGSSAVKVVVPLLFAAHLAVAQIGLFDPTPSSDTASASRTTAKISVHKKAFSVPASSSESLPVSVADRPLPSVSDSGMRPDLTLPPPKVSPQLRPLVSAKRSASPSRSLAWAAAAAVCALGLLGVAYRRQATKKSKPRNADFERLNWLFAYAARRAPEGSVDVDVHAIVCEERSRGVRLILSGISTRGKYTSVTDAVRDSVSVRDISFSVLYEDGKEVDVSEVDTFFFSSDALAVDLTTEDMARRPIGLCIRVRGMVIGSVRIDVVPQGNPASVLKEAGFLARGGIVSERALRDHYAAVQTLLSENTMSVLMHKNYRDVLTMHADLHAACAKIADRLLKTAVMSNIGADERQYCIAYAQSYARVARYAALMRSVADSYLTVEINRRNWFPKDYWIEWTYIAGFLRWFFGATAIKAENLKNIRRLTPAVVALGNSIRTGMYPAGLAAGGALQDPAAFAFDTIETAIHDIYSPKAPEKMFSRGLWLVIPAFAAKAVSEVVGYMPVAQPVSTVVTAVAWTVAALKFLDEYWQVYPMNGNRDKVAMRMLDTAGALDALIARVKAGVDDRVRKDVLAYVVSKPKRTSEIFLANTVKLFVYLVAPIAWVRQHVNEFRKETVAHRAIRDLRNLSDQVGDDTGVGGVTLGSMRVISRGNLIRSQRVARAASECGYAVSIISLKRLQG